MTAPNPKQQKDSRKALAELFSKADNVTVIHYSCESFYDLEEGHTPRITSIALRNLDSAQTISFSIHQTAEVNGIGLAGIEEHYDNLEKDMLNLFFSHLSGFRGMKYLHWNMRDTSYGFQAIEHRFRALRWKDEDTEPYVVNDNNKVDLGRLIPDIYGSDYIEHPRMKGLVEKNGIVDLDFLPGEEEALAFENRDFAALHRSTLRKVDVIANIAALAHNRNLKTNTTWWGMHGGRVGTFVKWISEHPLYVLYISIGVAIGIGTGIFGPLVSCT